MDCVEVGVFPTKVTDDTTVAVLLQAKIPRPCISFIPIHGKQIFAAFAHIDQRIWLAAEKFENALLKQSQNPLVN